MKPEITVAFRVKSGNYEFTEESVTLESSAELFDFVAPGGGCENIPTDVEQIRMVFLPPEHKNVDNPIADIPVMLQMHSVVFTGALAEISHTVEQIIDKAGRGELSESFVRVIGAAN